MLASGAAQQPAFATLVARLNETVAQLHQVYKGDVETAKLEIAQLRGIIESKSKAGEDEPIGENPPNRVESSHSRFELFFVSENNMPSDTHNLPTISDQSVDPVLSSKSLDEEANGEVASELFSMADGEAPPEVEYGSAGAQQNTANGEVASELFSMADGTLPPEDGYGSTGTAVPHISFNDSTSFNNELPQPVSTLETLAPISSRGFFAMRSPWVEQQPAAAQNLTAMVAEERKTLAPKFRSPPSYIVEGTSECFCVIHPESKTRGFWLLACMGFILYDVAMVPPEVCLGLEKTFVSSIMDKAGLAFWTADIAFSFFTGIQLLQHVEMRLKRIACIYIKSWFFFDLAVVIPEWIGTLVDDDSSESIQTSVIRVFHYGRVVKLIRMARILKLGLLIPIMRHFFFRLNLSKIYVRLTQAWVIQSGLILVFIHVLSCFWYALGDALHDGWVQTNGLKSASASRSYVVSLQWTVSRLHGMNSGRIMESPLEMLLDALLIFLSLGVMAYYFGTVSAVSTRKAQKVARNLRKLASLYAKRHRIPPALNLKVLKFLECSSRYGGAGEKASEDQILLDTLPKHLMNDLLFETRLPFVMVLPFFDELHSYSPRILYQLCTSGVAVCLLSDGELAFAYDDICNGMLFVVAGKAEYVAEATAIEMEELVWKTHSGSSGNLFGKASKLVSLPGKDVIRVQHHSAVSEAVLWTRWIHAGSLVSVDECTALSLPASFLAKVISEHRLSFIHACLYAKHFVWCLNHTNIIDDLTFFPELYIANLDHELFDGKDNDHFVFISHYKVEAGTEASLMRGDWEIILSEKFPNHPANALRSPIFIDSEDLTDLGDLKEHVIHTNTIVLLLTPGVLSRPWCLVEIVTAIQHNLNIVPVEIQRPGSAYIYPTEKFYADLQDGRYLPQAALDLLNQEGITLDDVENAIRQVFLKIALPFSPHKSKAIREAELQDIFKRCNKEWRSSYFSKQNHRSVESQGVAAMASLS